MPSFKTNSGFTLIELVVVIAILGVLASVLVILVDPADKINSANDAGATSLIKQLGKGEDNYASNNSSKYTGANNAFNTAVTDLFNKGEFKPSVVNPPTGYTYYYFTNPTTCTTAAGDCTDYFAATTLKSKKNTPGGVQGYFFVKNGKSCRVSTATAPTTYTSFDALACL